MLYIFIVIINLSVKSSFRMLPEHEMNYITIWSSESSSLPESLSKDAGA